MTESVRKLVKNLSRGQRTLIVYDNKTTDFEDIFKLHPLESLENKKYFKKMDQTIEFWGNGNILILRSAYTYDLLQKISQNSLKDAVTFYEIAKHTTLTFLKGKTDTAHGWYKTHLTTMWLSNPDNKIKGLNYWAELSSEQKDNATRLAIEIYGVKGYKNIEKKNLENLNSIEKIIEVFLHSNIHLKAVIAHKNNKIQEVIDYVFSKGTKIDYEVLTQSTNLKKYNPYILAQLINHPSKFFDINKVNLPISKLREINNLIMDSDKEFIPMKDFYELIKIQDLFIKMKNFLIYPDKFEPVKDFEFNIYSNMSDIISLVNPDNKFISKSFIKFFNTTKEKNYMNNPTTKEEDFWLHATLEMELIEKLDKKLSVKI